MLTHVDENNRPTMVDVSGKEVTDRIATAQSRIQFPDDMRQHVRDGEIYLKKGPVFQTALIAGTMAVKKTADVIPFCHHLPIEGCQFEFTLSDDLICTITCTVKTRGKTGVEMEALHGAMIASLTVYDMCKALSHEIVILDTKLLGKRGGKRTILSKPVYGLVLTGGKSSRMKRDKALIEYRGVPHAKYIFDTLKSVCAEVYLSAQRDQWRGTALETLPVLEDSVSCGGPIAGILSAFAHSPDVHWFVVACDLPFFNEKTAKTLLANCDEAAVATCFKNASGDFPEALCAIYTPEAHDVFKNAVAEDILCPVKVLKRSHTHLISQCGEINLANINTPEEFAEANHELH